MYHRLHYSYGSTKLQVPCMNKNSLLQTLSLKDIKRLYYGDLKSANDIANIFGCSASTIRTFMLRNGIKLRNHTEAGILVANCQEKQNKRRNKLRGKPSGALGKTWKHKPDSRVITMVRTGEYNHNWQGGISFDIEHRRQQRQNHKAMRRGKSPHMPKWANLDVISEIYKQSREEGLTVDHIVPLNNKRVCGLHCEHNLQLLTAEENRRKGNKFDHNAAINVLKSAGNVERGVESSGLKAVA